MKAADSMTILALAPACDGTDVGEAWCAYQWVSGLAKSNRVTLLTMRKAGRLAPSRQFENVEVIEWDDLPGVQRWERLNSMLKPGYLRYYGAARSWIQRELNSGRRFDIAHQFSPIALRYPSPATGLGIPLVIGPLAGSIETPKSFLKECGNAPWYTRLRGIDRLRLRYDPLLRRTYSDAAVVIGVAPYIRELMADIPLNRFEIMSELGINDFPSPHKRVRSENRLRLAHVGRVIRTKGLRDVVRALARLRDVSGITLESAGDGEDLESCQREARELGVDDRITFHGKVSRQGVEDIYRRSDAFIFPSFREPSGGVVYESMRHGLPVITTDRGGPAFVVDETCGIRVPAHSPEELSEQLAKAILQLKRCPEKTALLAEGAIKRMETIAIWPGKISWLGDLYREVVS